MNNVVHFVRWLLPFTASFIRNQIVYHEKYAPAVVFAQKKEGPFYNEISSRFEAFYPFKSGLERYLYQKARLLGKNAKNEIKDYIKSKNPDILHIHYGVDCLIYADIIKELQIPSCVSFYGYDCTSFPKRFYGYGQVLLKKNVFDNPNVKAVLAMSEDMKNDLLGLGCPEEKIIVHYYGTETAPFVLERTFEEKDQINFLIISGLSEKKGHGFLLDSFADLTTTYGNKVHLHIVGDGPLGPQIQQKIVDKKLNNVTLHGRVDYGSEKHLEYFRMADVFVHPSVVSGNGDKEGIPGAIIEAMAAGLPVVSTYHAGIPFVIEDKKTGLLVKEHDVAALTSAMESLVKDTEYRKSVALAAQKHALEYLDIKEKEKELEEIYDSLIG